MKKYVVTSKSKEFLMAEVYEANTIGEAIEKHSENIKTIKLLNGAYTTILAAVPINLIDTISLSRD